MKKYFFLYCFLTMFIHVTENYSQILNVSKYKKPFSVMEVSFGYTAPSFDLAGSKLQEFYALSSYSIKNGFNANYTNKFTILNFKFNNLDCQLRTYLTIAYAQFNGSEDRAYNIGDFIKKGWPKTGLKNTNERFSIPSDTIGKSSIKIHSPYIAYGWEMALFTGRNRKSVISLGLDFNFNVLWGKVYDQPSGKKEIYNNILDNTRFGLGVNLGYSYRVTDALGFSISSRMHITNLFGKKSETVEVDGDLRLNDKGDTNINMIMKDRTIGFFGIYGGITFYIGGMK